MKVKNIFSFVVLLGVLTFSCSKSSNNMTVTPTNTTFTATLNGASETPANASTATGTANFTYNPVTHILSGTLTFSGLTAIAAHIHNGALGVAGPVVFPLGSGSEAMPLTSPVNFTSVALTQQEINDLMAGSYYVNVHSPTYPNGEIRGQLVKVGSSSSSTGNGSGNGSGGY